MASFFQSANSRKQLRFVSQTGLPGPVIGFVPQNAPVYPKTILGSFRKCPLECTSLLGSFGKKHLPTPRPLGFVSQNAHDWLRFAKRAYSPAEKPSQRDIPGASSPNWSSIRPTTCLTTSSTFFGRL